MERMLELVSKVRLLCSFPWVQNVGGGFARHLTRLISL